MFTGIIEATGTVASTERRGDVLAAHIVARLEPPGLAIGGSIAVNGCCLTATAADALGFHCELTEETLRRTAFGTRLRPGARVNLERPLRADGRFDGHIVQGHVDGVGTILELRRTGAAALLVVEPAPAALRYVVEKGSIAVDGISLTVALLRETCFAVALIPFTLEHTTLGEAQKGDAVNVEVDVVAKYVERLAGFFVQGRP